MQQCIRENAHTAIDQDEYQAKYDGLVGRFDKAKERLEEVGSLIVAKQAQREKVETFLADLEKMDDPMTAFREDAWYSLIEYATVNSRDDIRFTFKNKMEIQV